MASYMSMMYKQCAASLLSSLHPLCFRLMRYYILLPDLVQAESDVGYVDSAHCHHLPDYISPVGNVLECVDVLDMVPLHRSLLSIRKER